MPKRHRPGASPGSVLRHVEEIVLATSGEDTFEIVFAVAAARIAGKGGRAAKAAELRRAIAAVARAHPLLEVDLSKDASDELVLRVDALLGPGLEPDERSRRSATLDAVFESLVPRVSKSDKGQ